MDTDTRRGVIESGEGHLVDDLFYGSDPHHGGVAQFRVCIVIARGVVKVNGARMSRLDETGTIV